MKAVILRKVGELGLEQIPEPTPNKGQVSVRVARCALCRTDAKMWSQGHRDLILPRALGHEICGTRLDSGERVVVWPAEACHTCPQCVRGAENLCDRLRILGFNSDGGFSEKIVAQESSLISIPYSLPDRVACLAEPLACAINALEQTTADAGDRILIFGGGSLGLLLAIASKSIGAHPTVIETNPVKISKSKTLRELLDFPILYSVDNGVYDIAINACPSSDTLAQGVQKIVKGGRFCLFSGLKGDETFSAIILNEIHYRQLQVVGAYGCARSHMKKAISVLDRYQNTADLLIEREIGLEDVQDGLNDILAGNVLRIVVVFEWSDND